MATRKKSSSSSKGRGRPKKKKQSVPLSSSDVSSALLTSIPESQVSEDIEMADGFESKSERKSASLTTAGEWFDFRKKRRTSDNTLDRIGFPSEFEFLRRKEQSIAKCKSKDGTLESLKRRKQIILDQCRKKHYRKWLMVVHCGFSLLLWGVGSKRIVLSDFVANYCTLDGDAVLINGYSCLRDCAASGSGGGQSGLARRVISESMSVIGAGKTKIDRDPLKAAQQLIDVVLKNHQRLYIGINSIDCVFSSGRSTSDGNPILLQMLSLLVCKARRNIHLVLSMDSPKVFLRPYFSSTLFHFYSLNVNTYLHFDAECSVEWDNPTLDPSRVKGKRKGRKSESSEESESRQRMALRNLLNSLTPIHYEILLIVANNGRDVDEMADDEDDDQAYDDGSNGVEMRELNQGVSYQALFDRCYEEMLVDSEVKFRALYTELTDHNAICEERLTPDSETLCRIPYDLAVIRAEIVNRHEHV